MNKLFRFLAFLTPQFLTKMDKWLVTRYPLLWSSRFVHVVFYTLTTLLIFEALIYFIPLNPTILFVPLYISYISLVFGCAGLGVWLYSQGQYNIWRSYGKSVQSYPFRYTLTYIFSLVLFISCACLPCWNASKRAYDYLVDDQVQRVMQASSQAPTHYSHVYQLNSLPSKTQVDNAQFDSRNRLSQMHEEVTEIEKNLSVGEIPKNERQQSESRKENLQRLTGELQTALKKDEPRFWILYKQFFTANIGHTENDLSPTKAPAIVVNGHRYIEYAADEYNYYESAYYYKDEYGNFLQYNKFINWVVLESLSKKLFSSDFTNLVDVAYGKIELKTNEPQRFFRTLTDLKMAPGLFFLSELSSQDLEIIFILNQMVFAFILALTLAATLSSFFGIKVFFINLIFVIIYSTGFVVVFSIIDQTSRHLGDDEVAFIMFGLAALIATFALYGLYHSQRRRVVHGFLWLLSSISLPFAVIFSLLIYLSETFHIDPDEPIGMTITTLALLACAFWYLPSQMRLLYRIYALPR